MSLADTPTIATRRSSRVVKSAAPLREQAVAILREAVTNGEFEAGERLIESRLCDYLDVSRTVVREALRQLESEQLVSIVPNIGPIVRELSAEEAMQLYDVRGALESLASSLAAQNSTPKDIARLRKVVAGLQDAADDVDKVIELKSDFYEILVEMAGNQVIDLMLANIYARSRQLRRFTLSRPGRLPETLKEIVEIINAIEAGDAERAAVMTTVHVQEAKKVAMRALSHSEGKV